MTFLLTAMGFPPPAQSADAGGSAAGSGGYPPPLVGTVGTGSPLGRFADIITAVVSLAVIVAALLSHLGLLGTPDTFIDAVALVAVGVIYGTARGLNAGAGAMSPAAAYALETINTNTRSLVQRAELNTAIAEAAHRRLDAIAAPAAQVDHSVLSAGDPSHGHVKDAG